MAELKQRIAQHQLSDLFTLIYTSGTTGEPKGVMLDYANMAAQLYLHDKRLTLTKSDISLCFLPLSHVFERAWSFYVMHIIGAQNVYLTDAQIVRDAMVAVKSTVMCAVPRFYEKVYAAINQKVAKAYWLRRQLFNWALSQGKRHVAMAQQGKKAIGCTVFYSNADKWVLTKLKMILGGRLRFFYLPLALILMIKLLVSFWLSVSISNMVMV